MSAKKSESNVKTALRVIEIIEIFAREGKPLSLTELARELEAPVSSCLGLIRTLTSQGYLYETGRRQGYYPTGRLLAMAQRIARSDPILEKVGPTLTALRDAVAETVVLGKLAPSGEVVYLEVMPSPHPISYVADPGAQRHVHSNSLGKALLSLMSSEERRKLLKGRTLERFNERTLVTLEALEEEIARSRERGWFQNLGESMMDVGAIAWPLSIGGGEYAVSIAGPLYRIEPNLEPLAQQLRVACRVMEQRQ
ncbi:IclR family transcriptional regulator [Yanghanlia caeni]|uniref:IclR family transcriptional regulator n=1 Tax=Yanghanlia caeni TaxID=3064283 RepID=A0ABU1D4V5_9BURK|nr:IclR family transcriptional regulator [Alcaligenaceae bacterium LG-2]HZH57461.1 IclR family transcriptional regulator [Burkholderiaceae bacterium]